MDTAVFISVIGSFVAGAVVSHLFWAPIAAHLRAERDTIRTHYNDLLTKIKL